MDLRNPWRCWVSLRFWVFSSVFCVFWHFQCVQDWLHKYFLITSADDTPHAIPYALPISGGLVYRRNKQKLQSSNAEQYIRSSFPESWIFDTIEGYIKLKILFASKIIGSTSKLIGICVVLWSKTFWFESYASFENVTGFLCIAANVEIMIDFPRRISSVSPDARWQTSIRIIRRKRTRYRHHRFIRNQCRTSCQENLYRIVDFRQYDDESRVQKVFEWNHF